MNKNPLKIKAEKFRNAGYSYNMIWSKLGIAKSTLSNWFKDKPFVPNQEVLKRIQFGPIKSAEKSHNKRVKEIKELKELGIKEIGTLNKRDLWLLGLGLYLGEGSKSHEIIRIINSDPAVIKLAVKWFKDICGLNNGNITIALHLYPDSNERVCINFWKKITGLNQSNFRKTQIDTRKDKLTIKRKKLPFGTAHITIISRGDREKGVKLHRKINGWITGVLSQI